jgi:hypothetical protein
MQVNWFRNKNTVKNLYEGVENIQLSSQWDLSVNIVEGMSYGQLRGTDFVWTDGKKTVDADGWMLLSDASDVLLGSVLPDWNAGITTIFDYKGVTLSALVDISKGGSLYSTDLKYGLATGLFEETAGLNARGTEVRVPADEGGGYLYPNTVHEDGSPNTTYIDCYDYYGAFLYDVLPTAYHVHDASYVKLREIALGYNLPSKFLANTPLSRVTLSLVGRNLWLIHKNMPYYDPELSLSAGNIQGFSDGAYPSTRTIGFNITVGF